MDDNGTAVRGHIGAAPTADHKTGNMGPVPMDRTEGVPAANNAADNIAAQGCTVRVPRQDMVFAPEASARQDRVRLPEAVLAEVGPPRKPWSSQRAAR